MTNDEPVDRPTAPAPSASGPTSPAHRLAVALGTVSGPEPGHLDPPEPLENTEASSADPLVP